MTLKRINARISTHKIFSILYFIRDTMYFSPRKFYLLFLHIRCKYINTSSNKNIIYTSFSPSSNFFFLFSSSLSISHYFTFFLFSVSFFHVSSSRRFEKRSKKQNQHASCHLMSLMARSFYT